MRPFSPLLWVLSSILVGITTAADPTISVTSIQEHRVTGDQCTPNIHFCKGQNWVDCSISVTSPFQCATADNMDNVASYALDLNLCCRFYTDEKCSVAWDSWEGNQEVWYPGNSQTSDNFKAVVGSYQCLISNTTCPLQASSTSYYLTLMSTSLNPTSTPTSPNLTSSPTSPNPTSSTY